MQPAFSRRLFLGGLASLGVAATVKTAVFVPTLWGDMIHDDAPALNALFRGEPIRVLNGRAIEGDRPALVGGRLLLASPLFLKDVSNAVLAKASLTAASGFDGECLVCIDGARDCVFSTLHFDTSNILHKRAHALLFHGSA